MKQLFYILFFIITIQAKAQLQFTATVSSTVVGKNESFELKLLVENAGSVEQISPPSLNNFHIISGPNQESGMESINGHTKQYIGITYVLQPKGSGNLTIGAAEARADGKVLKSNTLSVRVTNQAVTNSQHNINSPFSGLSPFDEPAPSPQIEDYILKKGERLYDKINKNIFIRIETDKTACYVGEPLVVTYKLYTRLKSESNMIKNPSFNGFSVIDLLPPGNISPTIEKYEGRKYNVYVLRRAQLYPLQPGETELETAEVENNIHFIKQEYLDQQNNLFGGFFQPAVPPEAFVNQKVTLQSRPLMIHVNPLPPGKPVSFNGAVGVFTVSAGLEKNKFSTDDAGRLKLEIKGMGNLTLIPAPEILWPDGIEGYEPDTKDDLNKFHVPVTGSKTIEYPFTVTKEGKYVLPPLEFSFFDAHTGKYRVINTAPINMTIVKGNGKVETIAHNVEQRSTGQKFFDTVFHNRWMVILPIVILVLMGVWLWSRKERKGRAVAPAAPELVKQETATPVTGTRNPGTEEPFAGTKTKLEQQDITGFYNTLNSELKVFLASELDLPPATIDKKGIAEALDAAGIPLGTSLNIQALIDDIEWQLYTPFADGSRMQDLYERACMLATSLDSSDAGTRNDITRL